MLAVALEPLTEIIDRARDSFFEFHLRFPAEDFFRAPDVGLAHLRVVHRQRLVFDPRFRPGDADDLLGELFDRHLARVADVDRLVEIRLREPINPVDQIGDVTERAGLRAVAEDREGCAGRAPGR